MNPPPREPLQAAPDTTRTSRDDAPVAALSAVCFRYGARGFTLEVPTLSIAPGERVAVIGASGSGKTTLLHLLAGLLVPAQGSATLTGVDLVRAPLAARAALRARVVGLVFQELELIEHLDVTENVLLPYFAVPALQLDSAARERAAALLARVGLGDKLRRRPAALSQGERQRAALARALVTEPRLVLADEPTGNLDPETGRRALELLLDEARRTGAAVVMVTHDHSLLPHFDRTVDLDAQTRTEVRPC